MDTMAYSLPEYRTIPGKVVSMVVAPPAAMGANLPAYFAIGATNNNANTSLNILANKAIVPNSMPLYWVIKMLDKE